MKRFTNPILALLLCAALLLSLPVTAAEPAAAGVFYSQLDELAQTVYDAFCSADALDCFHTGESFILTFDRPFGDADADAGELLEAEAMALGAFELDHPELFWLESAPADVGFIGGIPVMTVTPRFYAEWDGGSRSIADDEAAVAAAVERIAGDARAEGGSFVQLLYVHDWLTARNEYNSAPDEADRLPRTPLSALTDAGRPVSQGYAAAFKLLCDALDIPCLIVVGFGGLGCLQDRHVWNQVLLDGRWYAVDAAYDDPAVAGASGAVSGYEHHGNFLAGADTDTESIYTFSDTHSPTGEILPGVCFRCPALSAEAYDGSGARSDGPDFVRRSIPGTGTAAARTQTVTVDGRAAVLTAYVLTDEEGSPAAYVRLRDLAALLKGTAAGFDVLWSRETGIRIETRRPYDHPNGSEGNIPFSGDQPFTAYLEDTCVDGTALPLTAFQIVWEGGSHTFYRLRDLGRALGFNVGWSRERGLFIETGKDYTDED